MSTWILLRGLTREARHWGDFPQRLGAALAGGPDPVHILTPDLPGNGRRFREPSPTRVEAMMEDLRRTLAREGRAPPYHLLAFSLGGMVAVAWARHHPEECRALVLLNTSLRPHNPFHQRLRPRAWPATLAALAFRGTIRERAILKLTTARWAELGNVLPDWTAWARECPVSRANALRQLLAAARFSAVERPATELLFLAGARDNLADPRCSRQLSRAWGVDLAVHPAAGHDLPLDDGDWVVARVGAWLAGRDGVPALQSDSVR